MGRDDTPNTVTDLLRPGSEPVPGYHLLRRLGRGGFGEVWRAEGPGGFPVALKFVRLEGAGHDTERRGLEILKSIRHPHLLTTFGAWQVQGFLVIALELADRTLLDRFQEARDQGLAGIPRAELLGYFQQAAWGIDHLNQPHHRVGDKEHVGIQHRDIKPPNLLLVGGGVKVADFGLARVLQYSVTSHTGSMTHAYAAPEFFEGETSSHSDQYSLAVTYCHLRTGRLPFTGHAAEVMAGHLMVPPDLTGLPAEEQPAVARALAKEPGKRWPSCRDFVTALAATTPAAGPETAVSAPEKRERSATANTAGASLPRPDRLHHEAVPPSTPTQRAGRTAPAPSTGGAVTRLPGPAAAPASARARAFRSRWKILGGTAAILLSAAVALWTAGAFRGPPPARLLLEAPPQLVVEVGQEKSFTIKVIREGVSGPVRLTFAELPPGVTLPAATAPDGVGDVVLTVSASADAAAAERDITVSGSAGALRVEIRTRLVVSTCNRRLVAAFYEYDYDQGLAVGAEALRLDSANVLAHAYQGWAHYERSEFDQAIKSCTEALRLDPHCALARTFRSGAYDGQGEYDLAIADCTEALRLDPKLALAHHFRGLIFTAQYDFDQAIDAFQQALRLVDPRLAYYIHSGRSQAHLGKRDYDSAVADCTEAIKLHPRFLNPYLLRGIAYQASGDKERADTDLNKALRLIDPKDAAAYHKRGLVHQTRGDLAAAIRDYTTALELVPQFAWAYRNRGSARVALGEYDKAIADYLEARRLTPQDAEVRSGLGWAYNHKQQYAEAITHFGEAIRLNPRNPWAHLGRGHAHLEQRAYDRAIADCTAALRLDAQLAWAYKERSEAHRGKGDKARAEADLDKAVKLDPTLGKK